MSHPFPQKSDAPAGHPCRPQMTHQRDQVVGAHRRGAPLFFGGAHATRRPTQQSTDDPAGHPYRHSFLAFAVLLVSAAFAAPVANGAAFAVEAQPRMLRVDLSWQPQGEKLNYEVQRASSAQGPWTTLPNPTPEFRSEEHTSELQSR